MTERVVKWGQWSHDGGLVTVGRLVRLLRGKRTEPD